MRARGRDLLIGLAMAVLAAAGAAALGGEAPAGTTILDTKSFWRFRTVWETDEIITKDGKIGHLSLTIPRGWYYKNKDKPTVPAGQYKVTKAPLVRLPEETSRDWMKPGFDDSSWVRLRGPMFQKSYNANWKLILMRGPFEVTDPGKVKGLKLTIAFRGGAVVYLNGRELVRKFMPEGKLTPNTPALPYPRGIYLDDEGYLVWQHCKREVYRDRLEKRVRRITGLEIPASRLRKGVNTLAVGIHRPPAPPLLYVSRVKRWPYGVSRDGKINWCRTGLLDIQLTAPAGAAVAPNTAPPKGRGFLIWNHSIIRKVFLEDFPDPFSPLSPIRLAGVRNGIFAGQVVVGDEKPIKGLKAVASDLTGPGTIPAEAVTLRYAVPDGAPGRRGGLGFFDSLEDDPPAEVPVYKQHGGAVQPIWLTVTVPKDAQAGDYSGKVTVTAEGVKAVAVPVRLRVIDWALPGADKYFAHMDVVQSPESVAMAYGVKMWSKEHLALLEKTFAILGEMGQKSIYISAVRRTHFGNEHAVVRWYKDDKGVLQPNFDNVEKYLDVATRHLGKIPGVIFYCWEPISSMGHAGGTGGAGRTTDRPVKYTLWDPKTGRLKKRTGPAWGTPESKVFWKKFTDGARAVLKKRGMEKSLLFGLIGDARPTKTAMADITNGVKNAKWAVHSHHYCDKWQGYDIGMAIALWGIHITPMDPARGHGYGWMNPFWLMYYPREMSMHTSLVETRTKLENWIGAKSNHHKTRTARGLGRIGGDFWKVVKDGRGRLRATLAGYYPESYWGQLNLNYCVSHILGKGKKGPLPTVRSEAFRENVQEVEARVFIERAIVNKDTGAKVGGELAGRCREALDKRIRMCLHSGGEGLPWFVSSGWSRRTEELFGLAAEVAKKLESE